MGRSMCSEIARWMQTRTWMSTVPKGRCKDANADPDMIGGEAGHDAERLDSLVQRSHGQTQ